MSDQPNLTPVQEQVLAAISGGATLTAAAQAASIHRNTIGYWRRTSQLFREALAYAQYDAALLIREQAEALVAEAYAVIHELLTNAKISAGARLNAAKFILQTVLTPPPPPPAIMHSPAQSEDAPAAPMPRAA